MVLVAASLDDDRGDGGGSQHRLDLALRQAVSEGYKQVEVLKSSRELAALRPREDFQQLIRQLEK